MEIFPYIFSVLLTALVMNWSRTNATGKPGARITGLFRYRDSQVRPRQQPQGYVRPGSSVPRR